MSKLKNITHDLYKVDHIKDINIDNIHLNLLKH